jgi:hypothetical protein
VTVYLHSDPKFYLYKKKKEAKTETAEMKYFRSAADYTKKSKIRNINIREKLNIFNRNNKIVSPGHSGNITLYEWKTYGFWRIF